MIPKKLQTKNPILSSQFNNNNNNNDNNAEKEILI